VRGEGKQSRERKREKQRNKQVKKTNSIKNQCQTNKQGETVY
jgi:hypothetical protein